MKHLLDRRLRAVHPFPTGSRILRAIRGAARQTLALLREIGDENAYARYLARHGVPPSGDHWRAFCDQRMSARYRKPKCC